MKFKYLGDKEEMQAFGHDFSNGQTPDVTNENAVKRLSANPFFEKIEDEKRAPVADVLKAVAEAATVEELAKLAEGEDRKTVLEAIEKRKTTLSANS